MALRRSALYMPGNNARALEKARTLAADVLILDLEDAVAPDAKETARQGILAALQQHDYGWREVVVRINDLHSEAGQADLAALCTQPKVAALLLPKVESADTVQHASQLVRHHGGSDSLRLWAMIETPLGVARVEAISAADARLGALVLGTNDLSKALRVPQQAGREGFLYALSRCVLAARCHGLDVLDGVHIHLEDEAGLVAACEQGRALGFDGKTLIHPRQLEAANRVFAPAAAEVAAATRLVQAWEAAGGSRGVMVIDGRLVEALHVDEARRTVALAAAIAARSTAQS